MSIIKTIIKRFIPVSIRQQLHYMDRKEILLYLFFQRILRINSNVPWPVHWASIVICPERIKLKSFMRPPGLLPGTYVQGINGIIIGENVWFAPGVKIVSSNHDLCDYDQHPATDPIEIGDDCWIAANVVILPGVKLGKHVVVAAGAVVAKSFPDNCLIGGVPAKMIKNLPEYSG